MYEKRIGSADGIGSFKRLKAGISGHGYMGMRNLYEKFTSRGPYIVRAVAALLHCIEALKPEVG